MLLRNQGSSKRSWWTPEGGQSKRVVLANILVMRMLYLMHICIKFGKKKVWFIDVVHPVDATKNLDDLRIFYAHQRGVHFLIEQPMTSVSDLAFQKISCLYNNMFFFE